MREDWIKVTDEPKVAAGVPLAVYPKGLAVLLCRCDDGIHAIANKCAHMACPLEAGLFDGSTITCPCHDWRFDVRTGAFVTAPEIAIATFPVRVEDGGVLVDIGGVTS